MPAAIAIAPDKTVRLTAGEDNEPVVFGDDRTSEVCKPSIKGTRWRGESPLIFSYPDLTPGVARVENSSQLFIPGSHGEDARLYQTPRGYSELEIICRTRPTKHRWEFSLEGARDFDFRQQILTPEDAAAGVVMDYGMDGGYTIYHKTRRNHQRGGTNYRTGKWGNFQRPWAEDGNEDRIPADMIISDNVVTVDVDPTWLTGAVLPIRIGPTIGLTSIGASFFNTADLLSIFMDTADDTGVADSIFVYTHTNSGTVECGVYDERETGSNLLTSSWNIDAPVPTSQWNEIDISTDSLAITNGEDYGIAMAFQSGGHGVKFDSGGLRSFRTVDYTAGLPDPLPVMTNSTNTGSIYVSYSAVAGGGRNVILGGGIIV